MPFSTHRKPTDAERAADARRFGVDRVFHVDQPLWWCRLTAPLLISWRLHAALLVVPSLGGFAVGVLVGMQLAG